MSTSPEPLGVIAIFPLSPLVIVMLPVAELPVCNTKSLSPLDLKTPSALPVPADTIPLINTVPLALLVIVSSFSRIIPAEPVTSKLVLAVIVVNAPAAGVAPPIIVPSIAPPSISTLLMSTSPVPFGVIAIFPFSPSVIVMLPVVELPVFNVTS